MKPFKKFDRFKRDRRPDRGSPQRAGRAPGWQEVAGWYSKHLESEDTYQEAVVFPGALKLLGPVSGQAVLDVACGEGSLASKLAAAGARVTGFDAAPALVERARRKVRGAEFLVGDAQRFPDQLRGRGFDAAACILAIQNIRDAAAVCRGTADALKSGGRFVIVVNHPCFRIPRQSSWGYDDDKKLMFRRVDRYLTPLDVPILMNPGGRGRPITTMSYHRPLSAYFDALGRAGFAVDALEEWVSNRSSDSGPRAKAENRSRSEFPLFLALRARKV